MDPYSFLARTYTYMPHMFLQTLLTFNPLKYQADQLFVNSRLIQEPCDIFELKYKILVGTMKSTELSKFMVYGLYNSEI